MKVLNNDGKENKTEKSEFNGGKVLRKLISKAEKRKSFAENFRIYAVLQSTITRLKLDNNSLNVKNISCKVKFGKTCRTSVEGMDPDKRHLQSGCVSNIRVVTVDDQDPLKLNSFFEELKSR